MVVGVVVGEEAVRATLILAGSVAHLVRSQVLVEVDLVGWVVVGKLWQIGGSVWHQILVVHHSINPIQLARHIIRQLFVAYSWLPEVVDSDLGLWEELLELNGCYGC